MPYNNPVYVISVGKFYHRGKIIAEGYSGHGKGLNNPALVNLIAVGPIPPGLYNIDAPENHPHLGPFAMALLPDSKNNMYGRSEFYLHGDNNYRNHSASLGCIVSSRHDREIIDNLLDNEGIANLRVVAEVANIPTPDTPSDG